MRRYVRPLVVCDTARPDDALSLAGGWGWFSHVELLARNQVPQVVPIAELDDAEKVALTAPRPAIAGLSFDAPRLMGILNTTPDSFSDGGLHHAADAAVHAAQRMVAAGVDILDVGGESTRPGAKTVPVDAEIERTAPVIAAVRAVSDVAISNDTRKAPVATAALDAGADLINDVSGFTFDAELAPLCAARGAPVCVMHAQGDPETMQDAPHYDDVCLDVYDFLATRIDWLQAQGIEKSQIIADPGIGFGKTLEHNLALLARISLFHSLGVPILLGASRKRFIGTLGGAAEAADRDAGSIAVALAAIGQGVQLIRAHDVSGHAQAIALWRASMAQG